MTRPIGRHLLPRSAFIRFALVGGIGFLIDAGVLTWMLSLGVGFYSGRLVSFFCAVTSTWYLNRVFTFESRDHRLLREWLRFLMANSVGGLINYATYAALIAFVRWFAMHPLAAVAVGSVAGLTWNYLASHQLVFARQTGDMNEVKPPVET